MIFDTSDIPALNFIINRILIKTFPLYSYELVKSGYIQSSKVIEIENEFECLLSVIKHYNIGNVTETRDEDHGASVVKNINTARFKKNGGFENLFKNLGIQFTDYESIKKSQEELNTKIDEIVETLKKQGFGQEILFEELQELKELYPKLNKKNWGQVLKGKLIDLGLSEVINREVASNIFQELTDQVLRLR